jgi:hypothetical protein
MIQVASRIAGRTVLVVAMGLAVGGSRSQAENPTFERLARDAAVATGSAAAASPAALDAAAANLRSALRPLDQLLQRSASGPDWRKYLDWQKLEQQASGGTAADAAVLGGLRDRLSADENGLEMPQFAAVRRAVERYEEQAVAGTAAGTRRLERRLDDIAAAMLSASATGSAEPLAAVAERLDQLAASGQASGLVAGVRGALARPNIELEVREDLLASTVNRPVDQVMPIRDVVLGTRIFGTGRTTGSVRLDFVPASDQAVLAIVFDACNVSDTHGSQGPVTVCSRGYTALSARRHISIRGDDVQAGPVAVSASTDSQTTGIGIKSRIGQRMIRKVATRRIAETRPQAEAIAEGKARDRLQREFTQQTEPAVHQIRQQLRDKLRGPLEAQGLFPESFHMHTTDESLRVVARKALAGQLAAATSPPDAAMGNVLTARVHQSAINNILEQKFGGRTVTQADAEKLAKDRNVKLPETLEKNATEDEDEQKPWAITFAKYRPISVTVDDGRVRLLVRGDKFVSGDRDFPAMDIKATYVVERAPSGWRLVREGIVDIEPAGTEPGAKKELTLAQRTARRRLNRRLDAVLEKEIDVPDLPLQGELEAVGPLPMNQLVARKDGWLVAGWRPKDPVIHVAPSTHLPPEALSGGGPVGSLASW